MPLFKNHGARALQAVGYANNTRSHFEEQDTWETGVIGNSLSSDGWLNRHLASSTGHGSIRAVAIGGNLPRMLRGRAPAYAIRGIADLSMPRMPGDADVLRAALETAYCTKQPASGRGALADLLSKPPPPRLRERDSSKPSPNRNTNRPTARTMANPALASSSAKPRD